MEDSRPLQNPSSSDGQVNSTDPGNEDNSTSPNPAAAQVPVVIQVPAAALVQLGPQAQGNPAILVVPAGPPVQGDPATPVVPAGPPVQGDPATPVVPAGPPVQASSPVSPVVEVIRRFLTPVENKTIKSRRVPKALMIPSDDFIKEMEEKERLKKEKEKEKAERQEKRKQQGKQSSAKTKCGTCGKLFEEDFHGESWIKCCECESWYHNLRQKLAETEYPNDFKCDDCVPLA